MFDTARRGLQAIHFPRGLLALFLMISLGVPRSAGADNLGDLFRNWLGFGKILKPESRPETQPNPSAPASLSLSSSGTIEGVQKKTSSPQQTKVNFSPVSEKIYHCVSGCGGACRLPFQVTLRPPSSKGETVISAGNGNGTLSSQGKISFMMESLLCDGSLSEGQLRFDCVDQNASCQEALYKM